MGDDLSWCLIYILHFLLSFLYHIIKDCVIRRFLCIAMLVGYISCDKYRICSYKLVFVERISSVTQSSICIVDQKRAKCKYNMSESAEGYVKRDHVVAGKPRGKMVVWPSMCISTSTWISGLTWNQYTLLLFKYLVCKIMLLFEMIYGPNIDKSNVECRKTPGLIQGWF